MKKIPLSQGKFAIVDDDDYDFLVQWKWHYAHGYAARTKHIGIFNGVRKREDIYMHRLIMGNPIDYEIDHINGNKSDNRRCNLRLVNKQGNSCNRPKRKQSNLSSIYKGVSLEKKTNKWRAYLTFNQKQIWLGTFQTQEKAALAYNEAVKKYHGEFCKLNEMPYE